MSDNTVIGLILALYGVAVYVIGVSSGWILHRYRERQAALRDYWNAKNHEQEREAYRRLRALGCPPMYGERE